MKVVGGGYRSRVKMIMLLETLLNEGLDAERFMQVVLSVVDY
jgi:hypothetical protein